MNEKASEEWLRHRLGYFTSMCIPAVREQSAQAFKWLVYFDAEREEWFEEAVNALADGVFEPVWVAGKFDPKACARDVRTRSSQPWVITTRVDNDDALARDFVEQVQAQFAERTEFVNFTAGMQLTDDGRLLHRSDPSNAFISLIEPNSDTLMSVYVDWHDRVSKYAPIRQVRTHPMWVQMVHGRNIANKVHGIRANPALLSKYFEVNLTAARIGMIQLVAHQMTSIASLAFRVVRKPHRMVWLFKVIRARLGVG
nr:glycosyltransferase [Pseudarthrobacter oxydans]